MKEQAMLSAERRPVSAGQANGLNGEPELFALAPHPISLGAVAATMGQLQVAWRVVAPHRDRHQVVKGRPTRVISWQLRIDQLTAELTHPMVTLVDGLPVKALARSPQATAQKEILTIPTRLRAVPLILSRQKSEATLRTVFQGCPMSSGPDPVLIEIAISACL